MPTAIETIRDNYPEKIGVKSIQSPGGLYMGLIVEKNGISPIVLLTSKPIYETSGAAEARMREVVTDIVKDKIH
jgi:hypothetical protein